MTKNDVFWGPKKGQKTRKFGGYWFTIKRGENRVLGRKQRVN